MYQIIYAGLVLIFVLGAFIPSFAAPSDNDFSIPLIDEIGKNQSIPMFDFSGLTKETIFDYFDELVLDITQESSFYDLIGFSIGMFVYGIFIFHFYRFLAKKDMFSFKIEERLTGHKLKSSGQKVSASLRVAAYIATNIFIFPIVIFLWFLVYSLFMFFLAQDLSIKSVFLVSSSLIIAVRIAAYYNEELSRDLAKLLPFALLGIFLISPTFFSVNEVIQRLSEIPNFIIQIGAFLLVAIAVETTLSILYLIRVRFSKHQEKPPNISDSEHPI